MKGHRVTGYRNLSQYHFSETQNFFAFCRKWLKVAQKNSLRSRGVLGLTMKVCFKASKKSQKDPE